MKAEELEAALQEAGMIIDGEGASFVPETGIADFAVRFLSLIQPAWRPISEAKHIDGAYLWGWQGGPTADVIWWDETIGRWDWQGNADDCNPKLFADLPLPPAPETK